MLEPRTNMFRSADPEGCKEFFAVFFVQAGVLKPLNFSNLVTVSRFEISCTCVIRFLWGLVSATSYKHNFSEGIERRQSRKNLFLTHQSQCNTVLTLTHGLVI